MQLLLGFALLARLAALPRLDHPRRDDRRAGGESIPLTLLGHRNMDAVEDIPDALPGDLGLDTEVEKAVASNLERGYTGTVRVTT